MKAVLMKNRMRMNQFFLELDIRYSSYSNNIIQLKMLNNIVIYYISKLKYDVSTASILQIKS